MNKFIVFNCGYNGHSIIRDLGREGIKGYALDTWKSVGTYSRYAKYIPVADPKKSEKDFIDQLIGICQKEPEKPLLFATNDEWVAAISKNKEILKQVSIPVVSDWGAVKMVLDKSLFYQLGAERGYETPKTWKSTALENIPDNEFPLIIKPIWRRMTSDWGKQYSTKNLDNIRFILVRNKEEAWKGLLEHSAVLDHILLQSYIPGVSDCKYSIGVYANSSSEVLAMFKGRKKRGYPAAYGDTVVGETAEIPDHIVQLINRCTKEIGLEGILEFEFLYDSSRNKFWLLEINPRSWSWVGVTRYAGVSLPWLAYKDRVGLPVDLGQHQQKYKEKELIYMNVSQDFNNALFRYKEDYPEWHQTLFSWIKDLRKAPAKKIVFADLFRDDIGPTRYSIKAGLNSFWRNIRNKQDDE